MTVELLIEVGIPLKKAQALYEAGFKTPSMIARAKLEELTEVDGIASKGAIEILSKCQTATGIGGIRSGLDIFKAERKTLSFMAPNQSVINIMCGGGAPFKKITEIWGQEGAAKSQILFQSITNCIAPVTHGGLGRNALFIDAENIAEEAMFRISQMLESYDEDGSLDVEDCLGRIRVVCCPSAEIQVTSVLQAMNDGVDYGLLALDGIMTLLSMEFIGRGKLAERQGILSEHMSQLKQFGEAKDCPVIITNQVHDKPDAMFGDPVQPKGGHVTGHNSKLRIKVRKGQKGKYVARLMKYGGLPETETIYEIKNGGVFDGL